MRKQEYKLTPKNDNLWELVVEKNGAHVFTYNISGESKTNRWSVYNTFGQKLSENKTFEEAVGQTIADEEQK